MLIRTGFLAAAVATLTWTVGFANADFLLYALTCPALAVGYALAAFGRRTIGMGINAAAYAFWTIGFALDGFGWPSTTAAGVLAVGSVLVAWPGRRWIPVGVGASIAANLWYLVDNSFLNPYLGFALGNWIFTIGLGTVLFALLRPTTSAGPAATAV